MSEFGSYLSFYRFKSTEHTCRNKMANISSLQARGARQHVSPTYIRTLFSESLSEMYKSEVTLYADLVDVVNLVNNTLLDKNTDLRRELERKNDLNRLDLERHGAIRLGLPQELRAMARFLRTMDMVSVGYYDLTQAGLPIHATCFRTTDLKSLAENPLRLFVSLLRPEYVSSDLRPLVEETLSKRRIFSSRAEELVAASEQFGGLTLDEATELVIEGVQTFRWRGQATVSELVYKALLIENPILADIVAFQGPHINHLTPRALDIDAVQVSMRNAGLPAKQSIEGPPRRKNPILLRQTSYYAQHEDISFLTDGDSSLVGQGFHTARFGEIEERGAALSRKGRDLYDALLEAAMLKGITAENEGAYTRHFQEFPDDWNILREQGLVWTRYTIAEDVKMPLPRSKRGVSLEDLIKQGVVRCEPIVYEDFLPISAAGIFQSNLKGSGGTDSVRPTRISDREDGGRADFEAAVGGLVLDEMSLYKSIQEESLLRVCTNLGLNATSRL